jgi:hypothetical protein
MLCLVSIGKDEMETYGILCLVSIGKERIRNSRW